MSTYVYIYEYAQTQVGMGELVEETQVNEYWRAKYK